MLQLLRAARNSRPVGLELIAYTHVLNLTLFAIQMADPPSSAISYGNPPSRMATYNGLTCLNRPIR